MSMELTSLWAQICRISRSHGWILINRQSVQFVIKTSKSQWKNIYRIYLKCPNNSREKLDKWKQNLKYRLNRRHKIWTRWCIGLSNGCLGAAEKMRPVKMIGWNSRASMHWMVHCWANWRNPRGTEPAVQVEGVGALFSPLPKEHVKLQEFKSWRPIKHIQQWCKVSVHPRQH